MAEWQKAETRKSLIILFEFEKAEKPCNQNISPKKNIGQKL